jgi:hypothetical protein
MIEAEKAKVFYAQKSYGSQQQYRPRDTSSVAS